MYTALTKTKKDSLLAEFQKIKSVKKKFDFWEKNLNAKYIEYILWQPQLIRQQKNIELNEKINDLKDFEIRYKENEIPIYNSIVLKEYKSHSEDQFIKTGIIETNDLNLEFDAALRDILDKTAFIKNEITKIDNHVGNMTKNTHALYEKFSECFLIGYNAYLFNGEDAHLFIDRPLEYLIQVVNGRNLAEHRKYLEELAISQKKKSTVKPLRIEQQYYIMEYLGFFKKIPVDLPDVKIANFLSLLFSKNHQDTREKVKTFDLRNSKISKEKRIAKLDLQAILPLFEGLELNEEVTAIKAQIEKLK